MIVQRFEKGQKFLDLNKNWARSSKDDTEMIVKHTTFKDMMFYHCYDCGWGEKGVYDSLLSYDQACEIIKARSCQEAADKFAKGEEDYFDFGVNQYMVGNQSFVEADWEGSQDY